MKKYRLIKEVLGYYTIIPKGTIFYWEDNKGYVTDDYKYDKTSFSKAAVELNPFWFTEIKEEEPNKFEKIKKLISHLKEYNKLAEELEKSFHPSQNSWSDNDMIEFGIEIINDLIDMNFREVQLRTEQITKLLDTYKEKRKTK